MRWPKLLPTNRWFLQTPDPEFSIAIRCDFIHLPAGVGAAQPFTGGAEPSQKQGSCGFGRRTRLKIYFRVEGSRSVDSGATHSECPLTHDTDAITQHRARDSKRKSSGGGNLPHSFPRARTQESARAVDRVTVLPRRRSNSTRARRKRDSAALTLIPISRATSGTE